MGRYLCGGGRKGVAKREEEDVPRKVNADKTKGQVIPEPGCPATERGVPYFRNQLAKKRQRLEEMARFEKLRRRKNRPVAKEKTVSAGKSHHLREKTLVGFNEGKSPHRLKRWV